MAVVHWLAVSSILLTVNMNSVRSENGTCGSAHTRGPNSADGGTTRWRDSVAVLEKLQQCSHTGAGSGVVRYIDCKTVSEAGNADGVYTIHPLKYPTGLQVRCMGSSIVIQKRQDGLVNFNRSWAEYQDGFGDLTGEFWLGNEKLRRLTEVGEWELNIIMRAGWTTRTIKYKHLRIVDNTYALLLGEVNNTHTYDIQTNQAFSAYDRDNDADAAVNCAYLASGGWWFKTCGGGSGGLWDSNLNGEYSYLVNFSNPGYRGIRWTGWNAQITRSEMYITPMN